MKSPLCVSMLALSLSACSVLETGRGLLGRVNSSSPDVVSSEPLTAPITGKKTSSLAILTLPDDSAPEGKLNERQYANGWRQSVSLGPSKVAGDWNDLSIDIQTEPPETGRGAQIPMGKPTQEGIRREIIARFPTTPMRIVTRPMHNSLGPFGLAIGADGDLRCAFAWQWLDSLPGASSASASIRMRLCRTGVTADQLADAFGRLEIASAGNVERVLEATKLSADAGRDIIMPQQRQGVLAEAPVSLESSIVAASRASVAKTPVANAPPKTTAHRQARRAIEPAQMTQTPAPFASQSGRQYLAPVASQAARYDAPQPQPPVAGLGTARTGVSLPPQAFRGPSAEAGNGPRTGAAAQGGERYYLPSAQ